MHIMGLISWLIGFFFKDEQMGEIKDDIHIDKKLMGIDKTKRKNRKKEEEGFKKLFDYVHLFLENVPRDKLSDMKNLTSFEDKVKEIEASPGIRVESQHLLELADIWKNLLRSLENDFRANKEMQEVMQDVHDHIIDLKKRDNQTKKAVG